MSFFTPCISCQPVGDSYQRQVCAHRTIFVFSACRYWAISSWPSSISTKDHNSVRKMQTCIQSTFLQNRKKLSRWHICPNKQEDGQDYVKSWEWSVSGRIGHRCLRSAALWRLLHTLREQVKVSFKKQLKLQLSSARKVDKGARNGSHQRSTKQAHHTGKLWWQVVFNDMRLALLGQSFLRGCKNYKTLTP